MVIPKSAQIFLISSSFLNQEITQIDFSSLCLNLMRNGHPSWSSTQFPHKCKGDTSVNKHHTILGLLPHYDWQCFLYWTVMGKFEWRPFVTGSQCSTVTYAFNTSWVPGKILQWTTLAPCSNLTQDGTSMQEGLYRSSYLPTIAFIQTNTLYNKRMGKCKIILLL